MANVTTLPRVLGCKVPAHVKRRVKYRNRPAAEVISLKTSEPVQPASTYAAAYALYQQASAIDDSDPAKGIELYERALKLAPDMAVALVNIGNCYFRTGRSDLAEQYYLKALEVDPAIPEGLYNLGYLWLAAGRALEAIPLLRRCIESDPVFADAWFNLAMALEASGMRSEALPVQHAWRRYLALAPESSWSDIARRHLA